jgi:hypothetical protein
MKDITPKKYRCDAVASMCPAIFKTSRGTYIIIGKRIKKETAIGVPEGEEQPLIQKIGQDKVAVEIDQALLEEALKQERATDE